MIEQTPPTTPPRKPVERKPRPDISKLISLLSGTVGVRSFALTGLFVLAIFYTLYLTRVIVVPIVLASLLAVMIMPLVRWLGRFRIPTTLSAAVVLFALLGLFTLGVYQLSAPAARWMDRLPESMSEVQWKLRPLTQPVENVSDAAKRVEEATTVGGDDGTPTVRVRESTIASAVLGRTQGFVTGATLTLAMLFFLLASGDLFLRKLVTTMPRLQDKKRAVEIVQRIQGDISVYILTITLINIGLGVVVAIAMHLLGLPNAILWGVMAAVANFIPYLGAIVGMIIIGLVALLTFDGAGRAVIVMGVYYSLTALEGTFVTPLILGRRLTLNPVVIFVGLIFWGWLWGIPGALLAVPMLVGFKILCDHIEPLRPIGEFMGR